MAPYYSNPSLFPLLGGCACGLIRYSVSSPFLIVHCCHCTSCQRETGTAFALNGIIESTNVTLLPSTRPTVPASRHDPAAAALPAGPPLEKDSIIWTSSSSSHSLLPENNADTTNGTSPVTADQPSPDDASAAVAATCPPPHLICTPSESQHGQTIARCPACGVAVWSHYAGGGALLTFIRVGTLDHAWEVGPDVHIFTQSARRDFLTLGGEVTVPVYEKFYSSVREMYRADSWERYERLLPRLEAWKKVRDSKRAERLAAGR